MGSLSLLQGIFPTWGSNPGLQHYRQILYQLSHRSADAGCWDLLWSLPIKRHPRPHPGDHRLNFLGCALPRGRKPKRGQPGCPRCCPPLVASGSLGGAGTRKPEDGQAGAAGTSVWEDTVMGVTAPFGLDRAEKECMAGRRSGPNVEEGCACQPPSQYRLHPCV